MIRDLAAFLGLINSISKALLPGKMFSRALQFDLIDNLHEHGSYGSFCTLSPKAKSELFLWQKAIWSWNGKNLLPPSPDFTIATDSSEFGWGGVSAGQRISGHWAPAERAKHINFLELKAILLSLKAFFKDTTDAHVLIHSDNRTAISYINKQGGTHSEDLCVLAVDIWTWCLEKNLTVEATHVAGVNNTVADFESRRSFETCDWRLLPTVFQSLSDLFGVFDIDLFAARHNSQLPRFCSWLLDPEAETIDAFSRSWSDLFGYAFPPFILINRILDKVEQDQSCVILIAPAWPTQTWYAKTLSLLWHNPILLPPTRNLLSNPAGDPHPLVMKGHLPLVAWPICGNISKRKAYQSQLPTYSSTSSPQILKDSTSQPTASGLAGVLGTRLILFDHLR